MRLGSIMLDTEDNRRADITLDSGRIMCDGTDITPCTGTRTLTEAMQDFEAMYGASGTFPWAPEWDDDALAAM